MWVLTAGQMTKQVGLNHSDLANVVRFAVGDRKLGSDLIHEDHYTCEQVQSFPSERNISALWNFIWHPGMFLVTLLQFDWYF